MRILNATDLANVLSHADCVNALEPAMRAVSAGDSVLPLRQYMNVPGTAGKFTTMPGYVAQPASLGVKLVAKYPREADSKLGSHVGAVMLFEPEDGAPYALIDGAELTAIRTAAASALATRALARTDTNVLAILGAGTQARHHIQAMLAVREFQEIRIWSRTRANAQTLASADVIPAGVRGRACEHVGEAIDGADVICTTTSSKQPLLHGSELQPGMHVNLVGAAILDAAEADEAVVARSRFYIDYWASARAQAGELANAIAAGVVTESHVVGEIGQLLAGEIAGRQSDDDITTYKSLGVAAQDLAAGHAAHKLASAQNIGQVVAWP